MHRRTYLRASAVGIVALAGCTDDGNDGNAGGGDGGASSISGTVDRNYLETASEADQRLEVTDHSWYEGGTEKTGVRGTVKNVSGEAIEALQVLVAVLDESGESVSNDVLSRTDLGAGDTWEFEASFAITTDQASRYVIDPQVTPT
jgi:hypothetical protein